MVSKLWPYLSAAGRIWSSNPEINQTSLPEHVQRALTDRGAALLVPILGKDEPIGIIVLGRKRHRHFVYNLEEIELLRSLGGQLALAIERLKLVEREKTLVRESAEAQLVALRAQINPHFLFNSLNTIVSLIEERPDEAEEVVEHLAAIFRYILQIGSRPFVSMEDEFELVTHYLSIEQSRFGASLKVEQCLERTLRRSAVPAFAVQTLVENAVKHGLANRRGGGTLRIECRRSDTGMAEVIVADSGVGIPQLFDVEGGVTSAQDFFGIGLKNVSARLEQLYGRGDLLHLSSARGEGTTATLRLPEDPVTRNGDGIGLLAVSTTDGEVRRQESHPLSPPVPTSTDPHAERQASA
jgi:LytS/YehU family sensor histidine kinase